ncbi:ATP-binding protein [Fulvivirga sedimenti]|uniref:histidine kinase n=1 Tax=Fulvivirga sedimenti TaxID=2879465 RepID=A0A9X1HTC4_9BACT|nr:ATP-binding protein [Fulvivirga sedimenti]MCA6077949.1 tetratricopeptide repeat protein [Fulvivirga sedimenti]
MTALLLVILSFLQVEAVPEDHSFEFYLQGFTRNADFNPDSALFYAHRMLEAAHDAGNDFNVVRSEYALGYTYRYLNDYPSAVEHYRNAWQISRSRGFEEREMMASNGLGMSLYAAGNYPDALRYLYMSLVLREKRNQSEELATIYNNIGLVYLKLWNWQKAHEYFSLALLQKETPDRSDAAILVNLATCLPYMRRYEEAHQRFAQFQRVCAQGCSPDLWCDFYNAMGGMYLNQNDLSSALIYFRKVLALARENGLLAHQEMALDNLSSVEKQSGNYRKAWEYTEEAQKIAYSVGMPHRIQSNYLQMAELQEQLGSLDQSVGYWKKYDSMRQLIKGEEVLNEIYSYELEWIEKAYTGELAAREEALASTRRANVIFIGMSAIVGILAIMWWYNYRKKKAAFNRLEKMQEQLIRQEKMAALGSLIAGIAHELNSPLSAAIASVESGSARFERIFEKTMSDDQRAKWSTVIEESEKNHGNVYLTGMARRTARKELQKALPEGKDSSELIECLLDLGVQHLDHGQITVNSSHDGTGIRLIYDSLMLKRELTRVDRSLESMRLVLQSLRESSRGGNVEMVVEDINIADNLKGVLVLLHNQLKYAVNVVLDMPKSPPMVRGNAQQLSQVWINILLNSIQALPDENPCIKITVDNQWKDYVIVMIADNGSGISALDQPFVFDKFYTTKFAREGSGLGLNIIHKIVEKHGGRISFFCTPGQTRMIVFIPRL